jgi:hypothetical protein
LRIASLSLIKNELGDIHFKTGQALLPPFPGDLLMGSPNQVPALPRC